MGMINRVKSTYTSYACSSITWFRGTLFSLLRFFRLRECVCACFFFFGYRTLQVVLHYYLNEFAIIPHVSIAANQNDEMTNTNDLNNSSVNHEALLDAFFSLTVCCFVNFFTSGSNWIDLQYTLVSKIHPISFTPNYYWTSFQCVQIRSYRFRLWTSIHRIKYEFYITGTKHQQYPKIMNNIYFIHEWENRITTKNWPPSNHIICVWVCVRHDYLSSNDNGNCAQSSWK